MQLKVEGIRGKGRPTKQWLNAIECDTAGVRVNDVEDRIE